MVDATENRRGRPSVFSHIELYNICSGDPDPEHRGQVNRAYADIGINTVHEVLEQEDNEEDVALRVIDIFGISGRRRQGVLEQIGRMVKAGSYTEDTIADTIRTSIALLQSGHKSKEIEQYIRDLRKR